MANFAAIWRTRGQTLILWPNPAAHWVLLEIRSHTYGTASEDCAVIPATPLSTVHPLPAAASPAHAAVLAGARTGSCLPAECHHGQRETRGSNTDLRTMKLHLIFTSMGGFVLWHYQAVASPSKGYKREFNVMVYRLHLEKVENSGPWGFSAFL